MQIPILSPTNRNALRNIAQKVIISATSLMAGPLLAPTIWGLLSPTAHKRMFWATAFSTGISGIVVRFGLAPGGFLSTTTGLAAITAWIGVHLQLVDILIGVVLPVGVLTGMQMLSHQIDPGWRRVASLAKPVSTGATCDHRTPALLIGYSVLACGALVGGLTLVNSRDRGQLAGFSAAVLALGFVIIHLARRQARPLAEESCHASM